jgi:trk system potassium uptake protein TrkH
VSTGGFSTKNESIGFWDSRYIDSIVIVFMFLGGVNFSLIYNALSGKIRVLWENEVLRWYVLLCCIGTLICFGDLFYRGENSNVIDCLLDSLFHIVATITTTGFSVENYSWGQFSMMVLMLLMISCACAGSTSGGLKIDRMAVMLKNVKNEFIKALHPNQVTSVRLNGKVVPYAHVQRVIAFLVIFTLILGVSTTVLTLFNIDVFDSFFLSLSALCNVGYGPGIIGGEMFVDLPVFVKWLLTFDMLIGRLELFTVLILFTKGFWIK